MVAFSSFRLSIFWTAWFIICIIPYSTSDGLSINYLFVLTPIYFLFSGKGIYRLPLELMCFGALLFFVFLLSTAYQVDFYKYIERRSLSFLVFLFLFSLPFINFDRRLEGSFYVAIIIFSVYSSIASIGMLFELDLAADAIQAKNDIGTQRVGYVYLYALWIAVYELLDRQYVRSKVEKVMIIAIVGVIVIGLFLTYSRASFVSLVVGFAIFLLIRFKSFFRLSVSGLIGFTIASMFIYVFYYLLVIQFPTFSEFIDVRLIDPLFSGEMRNSLSESDTSEGTRIVIWNEIFKFVAENPWVGSGFLGSWVLNDQLGSAHNQFFDVFLRVGFLGFAYYIFLTYLIGRFLYFKNQALFIGFISAAVYGMFHETYKDSQGAFIFSFLLAIYSTYLRRGGSAEIPSYERVLQR